jgi:hypothetical protein
VYEDTSLTDDEKQARIAELQQSYGDTLDLLQGQFYNAFDNQRDLLGRYLNTYDTAQDNMIDSFNRTSLATLLGVDDLNTLMDDARAQMEQIVTDMADADKDRKDEMDKLGDPYENIEDIIKGIQEDSNNT